MVNQSGQAGKLDPRGPNKFEPETKAKPAPEAQPGRHTAAEKRKRAEGK